MKHSIATVSLAGTLSWKLEAIAAAGYDGFELFENDLTNSNMPPTELKARAGDAGLEIVALQPFRDFEAMPKPQRDLNMARARHKIELMRQLGTTRLLVCSNVSPHALDDPGQAVADLHALGDLAAEYGVEVGYEALAWGRFVNEYHRSWEIVKEVDHPNVGIILDSYHILVRNTELGYITNIPPGKIVLIQVADAPGYDMGALWLSRHHRCFPGQGSLDIKAFRAAVAATGYAGYCSHEIFSDQFRSWSAVPTAKDGKRSLQWMERLDPHTAPQQPAGLEFIEFSCNRDTELELVDLLHKLGFRESAAHVSKDVRLYRQGDVHIVINRQTASHAYRHYLNYGVAVCAVGLSVPDVDGVTAWIRSLDYPSYESRADSGEMQIPAASGPGDVLYYFVSNDPGSDRFHAVDFAPIGGVTAPDNGIRRIDHIGQVVTYDEYLPATLYYRSALGLDMDEAVEVHDPYGVVTSRVVTNADRSIRIALSTSQSFRASPNRFMETLKEGGIQQIALASDDIFRTAEAIDDGIVLPIPRNYYHDLRARTSSLTEDTLDRMERRCILFDENDSGSFFHFYTRECNGLFFEVVQRIGGYDRFGEPNAQVRLASQARQRGDRDG